MKISNAGINLIKREESCSLTAYRDIAGIATIGWGATMHKSGQKVRIGDVITQQQADDLLAWEVSLKETGVNNLLHPYIINQNQYDALVSFTYNVGIGALASSTLLKKVRKTPCDASIRDEFMKWNKISHIENGVKKYSVSVGLTKRRNREADLYFSNVEQPVT